MSCQHPLLGRAGLTADISTFASHKSVSMEMRNLCAKREWDEKRLRLLGLIPLHCEDVPNLAVHFSSQRPRPCPSLPPLVNSGTAGSLTLVFLFQLKSCLSILLADVAFTMLSPWLLSWAVSAFSAGRPRRHCVFFCLVVRWSRAS